MFRSLSSKNSASSSKRKKTDQSSRRTESVTSSSTHRKYSRNDERFSKSDPRKSTSTQPLINDPSGLSSYYTTSAPLNQLEPRSLTEEAIRSLDEGWGDTYSHADDSPQGDGHTDKRDRFNDSYKKDTGRRYNEGLEYRSPTEEVMPNERSIPRGEYAQNSFGTSSHVQDQFPGQDPLTFARPAFNQTMTQGVATGGAAAEYYSQASMQPHGGSQHVPPQAYNTSENTPIRPTGRLGSLMSDNSAYPNDSYTTAPAEGPSYGNAASQNYTYHQPHHPNESYAQEHITSHETYQQHSQSVPSATTYTNPDYTTPLPSQLQGNGQNLPYVAAAGAAIASAHSHHHHNMHQHNHSAPINNYSHGEMHAYSPPRPYTSGAMAMQHKHKGPVSKFVDWWKDYEDVRKMEEYTEYIGVCKYCFDPRSTATDAPRKHYRGGRRSSETLRRRSSDSLRRSHTNGSNYGRIDKDARYHSSDSECRSKRTSWLGAGVAAYGLSKVGKSLWQNSRDFDDTYSVKSGRKSAVSRNGSRREATKIYSSGHDSRSERTNDRSGAYNNSSDRFETGTQNLHRRSEHTSSGTRHSEHDRHSATKSGFATAGNSRHTEDQIHVRHSSPGAGHTPRHAVSRPGRKSRSRSQSPSLAQILGLTSSQKRTSATASRSSSPQQEGMFTGFFTKQPSRNRSKQSKKKKGFFNFANSSSSSANSDLAFGIRPTRSGKLTKRPTRKSSDEHLKATLLGIGATAAALSAVQHSRSGSRKVENTRSQNRDPRQATRRSKQNTSEEDGWESATDDESVSSGLAFGDFDASEKRLRRQRSSESITSQSSGTDKWSWRWRRKSDKKPVVNDTPQTYQNDNYAVEDPNVITSQPLRYVHPAPIASPMHSNARSSPSIPGAFPEQPYAINSTPIQQPQPVMPMQSSIFGNQTPPDHSRGERYSPGISVRPAIPTELRRTQSSPVSNHTMRNAAIAGVAGMAAAGILANGKGRARDDSPSNVRFELTEKQAKKEERQHRKENAKESKERAKEEARENKERARLDRERAMQEESARKAADDARRYAEEAERQQVIAEQAEQYQARLREAAAVEASDRRREEEIKEFMRNALAEQAREAEQKKQRETWQAQQMAAARQNSPPSPRAGPSTTFRSVTDTLSEHDRDHPQHDRDGPTDMPYATRFYEPSNEHSGQPLMDDDLIDPDFFTRRRSHSDLARHDELARKAAAKIVADLEDKYKDPAPSQAEFFAPKELFEPSKGKTKVHGPIDDTDYQVYHMSEDQVASMPNEPPPPYQPSYQFANMRDKKSPAPWDIPKLNVIAPTPPASYAGSAKDDKSPISTSKRVVHEVNQESDADIEPQKSSKISWGEDQTRFYEITTPESSQEHVALPDEIPHGLSGLRSEYIDTQAQFDDGKNMNNHSDSNMDRSNEHIEEIAREAPFVNPERFYQQPFVESVDDIAFTLDSPGTEGAPPVQGFVEGEIDDAGAPDDQMPHIPGGFDDISSDPQSEDTFNKDVQGLDREIMQEQQAPRGSGHSQTSKSPPEKDQDDYFMTKKQRKRRDKEAKRTSLVEGQRSPLDISNSSRLEERPVLPGTYVETPGSEMLEDRKHNGRSSGYAEASVVVGAAAAAVGALMHNGRSRSPTRRKSEPEDFDRQRPHSSHSEPRDTVSQSTPTSPVYERRPSLPSHAFDDLDMLPGSKRPKKSKRNSLLNYPAIGSPLRSAMTWDEYIEPMDVRQHDETTQPQSHGADYFAEHPLDKAEVETRRELTSPESERGAASIVSAPAGDEDSGRRRKHRKSHREREKSTSPRRSSSVAMSEPYETSHKHKRRSHRDDTDLDDASSIRSRSSHSSKRDDEESKTKKKGGILSLFRRKTSDDIVVSEQRRTNGDDERSKHHRRRQSSEHGIDELAERRDSTSRSRSHTEREDPSSRHSSSSRHRQRHHRDGNVDDVDASSQVSESRRRHKHRSRDNSRSPEKDFDDTQSQTSESRRKHRHRERDLHSDDRRSLSRDSKNIKDEDKSFLVDRVEDEESVPLPEDDSLSSSQAPESIEQPPESISLPEHDKVDTTEQLDDWTLSPTLPEELVNFPTDDSTHHVEEALSSPSPSEALSPPLEHMTPARPIVPLRVSSSTAVPLRFRRPPTSPSFPKERSASFSSSVAQSPSSPITPKAKRPLSTEFMHSTEFRPLYLLERTRKPQDQEAEQNLPSLPPSRSTSSSSLQSSEDWQSAAEDFDPSEHDNLSPPDFDQLQTEELEDVLGSAQTTPKATEFPKHVLESRPHLEPEYYSWSDMEREEHLRQQDRMEHHLDLAEEPPTDGDNLHDTSVSTDEPIGPNEDTEVVINHNPMATDVWGDLSDEELPSTEASVHQEHTEPVVQPEEPKIEPGFTSPAKKRKNNKAAKLGTSSISGLTSPVRETPAELARRREKDAQDAVDTWFKPTTEPRESAIVEETDASSVPLPESTASIEAEIVENEALSAPTQEAEAPRQEIEPTSPLLSRKKSKKGKKKQKSVSLDESTSEPVPTEEFSESQIIAEAMPQHKPSAEPEALSEVQEAQTTTAAKVTAREQGPDLETSENFVPMDVEDESLTPVSLEQPQNDTQLEEASYTMSKAERKKQNKKAKKAALSIAVPAVAAAALATSDRETLEQNVKNLAVGYDATLADDREDNKFAQNSVDDVMTSVPKYQEGPVDEVSVPEVVPESSSIAAEAERYAESSAIEHAESEPIKPSKLEDELPPEQIALPGETQDENTEPEAIDSISRSTTEITPREEKVQLAPGSVLEEEPASSVKTVPETTNKISSWFSWLPGSKTQEADEPKAEARAVGDHAQEIRDLTQEPFERLLEQPIHQPEFVNNRGISEDPSEGNQKTIGTHEADAAEDVKNVETSEHDENPVEDHGISNAQPLLEEHLPSELEVSKDDNNDIAVNEDDKPTAQTDLPPDEAISRVSEPPPVSDATDAHLPEDSAAEASEAIQEAPEGILDIPQEENSTNSTAKESEPVEDSWSMPSKKSKKGKKGKKAVKDNIWSETKPSSSSITANEYLSLKAPATESVEHVRSGDIMEAGELELLSNVDLQTSNGGPLANLPEDVPQVHEPAPESIEGATASIESDRTQDVDEQLALHEPVLHAEPFTATAEDEWATPPSKKKKKKGKKGKQPLADFIESIEDPPTTQNLDSQPLETITTIADAPITPDVFETPAESSSVQYFATPADELAEQYFVTPMQEIPEQPFVISADDAVELTSARGNEVASVSQEQLGRSSVTPTQENILDEPAAARDESLSGKQIDQTDTTASITNHEVPVPAKYEAPSSDNFKDEMLDGKTESSQDEQVVGDAPQSVLDPSVMWEEELVHPHSKDAEQVHTDKSEVISESVQDDEPSTELRVSDQIQSNDNKPDLTSFATEQPEPQHATEFSVTDITDPDASVLTSSKKSKKDKKKAKKAKQQDFESELFRTESADQDFSAPHEKSIEPSLEDRPEASVMAEDDTTLEPSQQPEADPVIEDQPITRKLSKKEKRKAKKSTTSEFASPFEETPEQTPIAQDVASYFPDTSEHDPAPKPTEVDLPAESNVELESAPLVEPKQTQHVAEDPKDDLIVNDEPQELSTNSESRLNVYKRGPEDIEVDEAQRDPRLDAFTAAHEPLVPEEPSFETESAHSDTHVADISTAESVPISSLYPPHETRISDQETATLISDPEPAVVEDQAPSVLDQLILSEEPAAEPLDEPIKNDEVSTDMPITELVDENVPAIGTPVLVESSEEPRFLEQPDETIQEPLSREESVLEPKTAQESMQEEQSTAKPESASVKLSKKEKRKAKKSKQTAAPDLESPEPEESHTTEIDTPAQIADEDLLPSTEAHQEPTELLNEPFSLQPVEEWELSTAKLSKKAKKKAKKPKVKGVDFGVEEDDQSAVVQEPDEDPTGSLKKHAPGDPVFEPSGSPSIGSQPRDEPETEREVTSESTNLLGENATGESELKTSPGHEDTVGNEPIFEVKAKAVDESEHLSSPQPTKELPAEPALEDGESFSFDHFSATDADDIPPDSGINTENNTIESSRATRNIHDEVALTGVPDQNVEELHEASEQFATQAVETPKVEEADDFWSPISTSKKKNKKSRKAKLQQEGTEPGMVDDKSIPDLSNDPQVPITESIEPFQSTNDEPELNATEKFAQTALEEQPSISAADEWALPTKQSKKEKRKAKKLKDFEEPMAKDVVEDNPLAEDAMPGEVMEIKDEPVSHVVEPETVLDQPEPVVEPAVNEDWGFSRKPSKKEKRKAKKAVLNDEHQLEPEPEEVADVGAEVKPSISDDRTAKPLEAEPQADTSLPEASQPAFDPIVAEKAPIESDNQNLEAIDAHDNEPISTTVNTSQDIDLVAGFVLAGNRPEPVSETAIDNDWGFSRKPSKKEKRKAKKTTFSGEQQSEPGSFEPAKVSAKVQPTLLGDPLELEQDIQGSSLEEILPVSNPTVATFPVTEPVNHVGEASSAQEIESTPAPVSPSQDIDFAATLAAGLQDSGFDPSLVIDDPVFHRRASPTSLGEADPGEITSTTTRRPKRSGGSSRAASPTQDESKELSGVESIQPTEASSNADFSDALTAGLLASGFAPDALAKLSTAPEAAQDEPDEFSFAVPKRKKKGKKGTRAETITSEVQTYADESKSYMQESEADRPATTAIGPQHVQGSGENRARSEVDEESINEPTALSPTRLAKHTFFHTSEVSQSLPVRIDHSAQHLNQTLQPSADVSMIETLVKDIPRPTMPDADTMLATEQSQQPPATAQVHNEPATWSFDNLQSPTVQQLPKLGPEMQTSDPFVSARSMSEQKRQTVQAEPISPVDSTTKDRTSYLFQSPVDLTAFDKAKDPSREANKKQTRFQEPQKISTPDFGVKSQTPTAPLPPSPSEISHIPLPPVPSRVVTPPAPLPPSPSRQSASSPVPLPPSPHPVQSPPLTRKKSLYDVGSPGPGHSIKAARRSATPQQLFREQNGPSQVVEMQAEERDTVADRVPILRPMSSDLSTLSNKEQFRSTSSTSNHSAAPSLRRINRSLSGDLRAASRTHGPPTTIPIEPPPTPPLQDEDFNGHGASRPLVMANIYVSNHLVSEI
ncbi:hypothetical protein E4T52_02590 [Aureobasidium sp. EXF-3400]|nr:hypothetical protein E4T51_01865 [Aureobasidium sp. EXF-12344]KAI4782506.1 hypothetical protein E4T52_02590 [Aureobasidium sp. EXF-3400]